MATMSIEALLIVLMAGTEIFRPLRDLRAVLHQGLNGQAAASGIIALLDTPARSPTGAPVAALTPEIDFDNVVFAYPGGRRPAHAGPELPCRRRRTRRHRRRQRFRQDLHRAPAAARCMSRRPARSASADAICARSTPRGCAA